MKALPSLVVLMCLSFSAAALAADYKSECVNALESPDASQVDACGAITDELSLSCVEYLDTPSPQEIRSCGAISNENALSCVNVYQAFKSVAPNVFAAGDIDRCSRVATEEQLQCVMLLSYPKYDGFDSCLK